MKLFTASQIREADQHTIQNEPITSINLMERAANKCTKWLLKNFKKEHSFVIFTGPGNNGGDGIAIARQLTDHNIKCELHQINITNKLSQDCIENLTRIKQQNKVKINQINTVNDFPKLSHDTIIIDAIFGSGLSRPITGITKEIVYKINESKNIVISIDIPSGLFSESNQGNTFDSIIKADHTLTFQFPKLSFFNAQYNVFVGKWYILDIKLSNDFIKSCNTRYYLNFKKDISQLLVKRPVFSHKGTYGHAFLIAGSKGKIGAAIIAAKACLKSGCGLLTTHLPSCGGDNMQISFPEAMISEDSGKNQIENIPDTTKFNAIGIGPGIGTEKNSQTTFLNLLNNNKSPIVIDADGINILAQNKEALNNLPPNTILTPHPKEFERLFGKLPDKQDKLEAISEIANKYKCIIVYKEAYTKIFSPEGDIFINNSGNPGMATAGSGDALTGIILSLLAQNYKPITASKIGVFLHGLAGDIYAKKQSSESLITEDIINNLGYAFKKLKNL